MYRFRTQFICCCCCASQPPVRIPPISKISHVTTARFTLACRYDAPATARRSWSGTFHSRPRRTPPSTCTCTSSVPCSCPYFFYGVYHDRKTKQTKSRRYACMQHTSPKALVNHAVLIFFAYSNARSVHNKQLSYDRQNFVAFLVRLFSEVIGLTAFSMRYMHLIYDVCMGGGG